MPEYENPFLEAALRYAEMGYRVFPCWPETKFPITDNGFYGASTDPAQVLNWWQKHPKANIAIHTTSLLVVDIDGKANPWLSDAPEKAADLALGVVALTPRGGKHYIFKQPCGKAWSGTIGKLAPNVDTRAEGGYVLLAPSVFGGKTYEWLEEAGLEGPPDTLPEPPAWLVERLDGLARESTAGSKDVSRLPGGNPIPEGQRNHTLARLAGTMRRVGMGREPILAALQKVNTLQCRPPLPEKEVERVATSISKYEPDQVSVAVAENHWAQDRARKPTGIEQLEAECPSLRPPVIHGLLREGETMNVISSPKIGKSWLVIDLALAVATGRPWLGEFKCEPGSVLIIDNELHKETSARRIPEVMRNREISRDEIRGRLFVENLRGQLQDLISLGPYFDQFEPGQFKMVILDAFYRFLPMKTDENDNGTMASLYNHLDRYADRLKCCFVLIHHTSKGNQSAKEVTDVGAGAGAQSRATDTHLVLRKHEEEDVVVLDATVRSWPPQLPLCLRWTFPVWTPDRRLDPAELKRDRPARKTRDDEQEKPVWSRESFVERFVTKEGKSVDKIVMEAEAEGLSSRKTRKLLRVAAEDGDIFPCRVGPMRVPGFSTEKCDGKEPEPARDTKRARIEGILASDPRTPTREIAERLQVSRQFVNDVKREWKPGWKQTAETPSKVSGTPGNP